MLSSAALTLGCAIQLYNQSRKKPRKILMKQWLKEKDAKGAYSNILQELRFQDQENFRKYLRMNTHTLSRAIIILSLKNRVSV